jgi:hypothetical protein
MGATAFSLGAVGVMLMIGGEIGDPLKLKFAAVVAVCGAIALGIGWCGIFQQRQAGFGVIAGSFAIPLASLILYAGNPRDLYAAGGMILLVALAGFALAHAFVKNMPVTRIIALIAVAAFMIQIIANTAHVKLGADLDKLLFMGGMAMLVVLGIALAVRIPTLRDEPTDPDLEGVPKL